MRQTSPFTPILAAAALVIALVALLGERAAPAAASSLSAQIGPAATPSGGFTYQGSLSRGGQPVNGADACDLRFSLWDAASGGAQLGASQTVSGVEFVQGLFAVTVNEGGQFGDAAFAAAGRWLQVEAACPGGGAYTSLGRQALTAVPYATLSQSTAALQGHPVSGAAPAAGQLLAWDGSAWAPADETGAQYQRTILVSPGETAAESGAALRAALDTLDDASAERPYLLKLEPGVYDLGDTGLQMKPFVDIEGSGQGVTILTGAGGPEDGKAVLFGANNAELRALAIHLSPPDVPYSAAIRNLSASPRLTDVTVRVTAPTGGGNHVYGIANSNGSAPLLRRVTLVMRGGHRMYGLHNTTDSSPTVIDSTLDVGSGYWGHTVYNTTRSSPTFQGSTIIGVDSYAWAYGIYNDGESFPRVHSSIINAVPPFGGRQGNTTRVANSMVESRGSFAGWGVCVGTYDASFAALDGSCN